MLIIHLNVILYNHFAMPMAKRQNEDHYGERPSQK